MSKAKLHCAKFSSTSKNLWQNWLTHSPSYIMSSEKLKSILQKQKKRATVQRTCMRYLNKIFNHLSGAIKISVPLSAAAILGMPSETCSDSFWVAYVTATVSYTQNHQET